MATLNIQGGWANSWHLWFTKKPFSGNKNFKMAVIKIELKITKRNADDWVDQTKRKGTRNATTANIPT